MRTSAPSVTVEFSVPEMPKSLRLKVSAITGDAATLIMNPIHRRTPSIKP